MLEGNVVRLRTVSPADLPLAAELSNDPFTRASVVGWSWPISESMLTEFVQNSCGSGGTQRFSIIDKATDRLIGFNGLWNVDWHNRSAVYGVKMVSDNIPMGAGRDAGMLVQAWAFYDLGLHRLDGEIIDYNRGSYFTHVRLSGWRVEGRKREAVWRLGQWNDAIHVGLLRSDFDALSDSVDYVTRVVTMDPNDKVRTKS